MERSRQLEIVFEGETRIVDLHPATKFELHKNTFGERILVTNYYDSIEGFSYDTALSNLAEEIISEDKQILSLSFIVDGSAIVTRENIKNTSFTIKDSGADSLSTLLPIQQTITFITI